jgi:hypothetical protein
MVWEATHRITLKDVGLVNRIALWLADVLSDPSSPLTTEQMGHYRLVAHWFPDGQQALDRIERIYREDRPEICDALYLSLIVACVDKILSDTRPKTVTGVRDNTAISSTNISGFSIPKRSALLEHSGHIFKIYSLLMVLCCLLVGCRVSPTTEAGMSKASAICTTKKHDS